MLMILLLLVLGIVSAQAVPFPTSLGEAVTWVSTNPLFLGALSWALTAGVIKLWRGEGPDLPNRQKQLLAVGVAILLGVGGRLLAIAWYGAPSGAEGFGITFLAVIGAAQLIFTLTKTVEEKRNAPS